MLTPESVCETDHGNGPSKYDAGGRDSTSLISGQRGQLQAISLIRPLTQRLIHPIAVAPHHLEGRVDDLTRASLESKVQTRRAPNRQRQRTESL